MMKERNRSMKVFRYVCCVVLAVFVAGCASTKKVATGVSSAAGKVITGTGEVTDEALTQLGVTRDMWHNETGYRALSKGDYKKAEDDLNAALKAKPTNPFALLNLGALYQNTGRNDEAKKMYAKLIELNPSTKASRSNKKGAQGKKLVDIAKENMAMMDHAAAKK